jgi:hypothetical protein
MGLKKRLNRKITLTVIQRQSTIIVTLLATAFLMNIWPRFRNDALEIPWYAYLILIAIFSIPLFRGKK